MKLDKIKFAALVAHIQYLLHNRNKLSEEDMNDIDYIVTFDAPTVDPYCIPAAHDINELMRLMVSGTQKIEAIKLHRKLTGWGLAERELL